MEIKLEHRQKWGMSPLHLVKDSTWNPTVFTDTQKVRVNTTPCLLSVILDRSLTFNAHLTKLTASLTSSICIIRATAHTSWSRYCFTLKMAFHALIRSKLDCAAPTWQPWLSNTNLSCLDRPQNRSLWLIMGQLVSTPLEALRLGADTQSYSTWSNHLILKAKEKALRSTDDHPKRITLDVNIPIHLQNCSSFCGKAEELSTILPLSLQHRQNIIHFPSPPWQQSSSHEGRIATTVPGITGRADDTNLKRQCRLNTIASYQADYVIYTDGSASRRTRSGGAAEVVTRGSPLQPEVVTTIKTKRGTFASSYEEEAAAIKSALSLTSTNANHPSISILFCTDSKSLCEALISSNPWTLSIHNSINSISSSIFIQWIYHHSDIPGNDLANKQPKKPPPLPQTQFFLFLYLVPFRLLMKQFVTLTNLRTGCFSIPTSKGFPWCKADKKQKRWRSPCSSKIRSSPFSQVMPQPNWSITTYDLPYLPPRRRRSPSLAVRLSVFDDHKTKSVWEPSKVFRVACHLTWGCISVRKEDPAQPWRLT